MESYFLSTSLSLAVSFGEGSSLGTIQKISLFLAMHPTDCLNCHKKLEGNFCSNCGQPADTHRINAAYFVHELPHSVLHVDKGLFYTFGQLLKDPGGMLAGYLQGKRAKHFKPLAYVLMLSAVSALMAHWNINLLRYLQEQRNGVAVNVSENLFTKYQSLFILLMIPIVSMITWLVFRKNRFSFWEHMLMNTFLAAQLNVLVILLHIVILIKFLITGSLQVPYVLFTTVFMTGFMTYYATCFSSLMKTQEKPKILGLKLSIMCFLLASVYATGMAFTGISMPQFR